MPSGNQRKESGDKLQIALEKISELDKVLAPLSDDDEDEEDDMLDKDCPNLGATKGPDAVSGGNQQGSSKQEELECPAEDCAVVLAGFRFCAQEAIRFLMQEEHFTPNDPVIKELQEFLKNRQSSLDYGKILGNNETEMPELHSIPKCDQ